MTSNRDARKASPSLSYDAGAEAAQLAYCRSGGMNLTTNDSRRRGAQDEDVELGQA